MLDYTIVYYITCAEAMPFGLQIVDTPGMIDMPASPPQQ